MKNQKNEKLSKMKENIDMGFVGSETVEVCIIDSVLKHRKVISMNHLKHDDSRKTMPLSKLVKVALFSSAAPTKTLIGSALNNKSFDVRLQRYCRKNKKIVKVEDLFNLHRDFPIFISSKHGFKEIGDLFEHKPQPYYEISTEKHKIRCSPNQYLGVLEKKDSDIIWRFLAKDIKNNDIIMTKSGPQQVISKIHVDKPEKIYSFDIIDDSYSGYWAGNGILSYSK